MEILLGTADVSTENPGRSQAIETPIYWKTRNFAGFPFDSCPGKLYDFALMSRHVPDFINPIRAAEGGFHVAGQVKFSRMKRLLEVVTNRDDAAEVSLDFSVDGQGIAFAQGRVNADLMLTCQRCLSPMKFVLNIDFCLGIVASEDEAQRLPERYDPLIIHGDQLLIAEAVEDEIFLALPAFPRHDPAECDVVDNVEKRQSSNDEAEKLKASPFAVLAQLKGKR